MANNNGSAFYARVSTEEQQEKQTIQSQIEGLRSKIVENKEQLIKEYIDDGYTGTVLDRPDLDKLRDDAKEGLFNKLYFYHPDRIARDLYLQILIVKEVQKYGIEVVFLSQDFSDKPTDQLLFQMTGAIAEYERAQILERTRRGKLHKARNGLVVGGIPPYGFRYIKKTEAKQGRYKINETEAENLKLIFKLFNSQKIEGIRTLIKELHRLGIKNRSGSTVWSKSTLSRMLGNETYIGTTYWNKFYACEPFVESTEKYKRTKNTSRRLRPKEEWIAIEVPSILSDKLFYSVQTKLQRNSELSSRNTKYEYLLKGLVYCACGKRHYGYPCHGKPRYKCSDKYARHPLPKTCTEGSIDTAKLDSAVWKVFLQTLERPEVVASQVNKMLADKKNQSSGIEKQMDKVDKEISKLNNQEERLLEAYTAKAITLDQLRDQNESIRTSKEQLLEEKGTLRHALVNFNPEIKAQDIESYFSKARNKAESASFEVRQKIIRLFVNQVIVGDKKAVIKAYLPAPLPTALPTS